MNLEIYRKEFSIFIFNENIHAARWMKDALTGRGYETYFYSSDTLLRQAIYLSLPHIVVLPYSNEAQTLIADIRKISKEICILLIGEEADVEAITALVDRNLVYDFSLDPIKNIKVFCHRIDRTAERWLLSLNAEKTAQQAGPELIDDDKTKELFTSPDLDFIETKASTDSLLYEVLSQTTEEAAIQTALRRLAELTGSEFVYFKNEAASEILRLAAASMGLSGDRQGVGIKYEDLRDLNAFLAKPNDFKLWKDFFMQIFNGTATQAWTVKSGETLLGCAAALSELSEDSRQLSERVLKALSAALDGLHKSRFIFDNMKVEAKTNCLNGKSFYEVLSAEVSRSRRLDMPVSCLSFEIRCRDKVYLNRATQLTAKILKRFTRVTDQIGRVADDRFVMAFPHTPLENAAKKAGTLLGILKAAFQEKGWTGVEAAAGVNSFPANETDSMSLLQGSEEAAEQAQAFEVLVYRKEMQLDEQL